MVRETEEAIDKLIENGTYQGKKRQIHDNTGKPVEGSYQVEISIPFTFFSSTGELTRVRIPDENAYFDVTDPIKKDNIKQFLKILAEKYQNAGWRAESYYSGGEKGYLYISHDIDTPSQG